MGDSARFLVLSVPNVFASSSQDVPQVMKVWAYYITYKRKALGKGYGIKYMMLLKTNWELEEHIENIINNHRKLCADIMEPYGTNWEHQVLKKKKKKNRLLGCMLPHLIGWVRFLFLIGHH